MPWTTPRCWAHSPTASTLRVRGDDGSSTTIPRSTSSPASRARPTCGRMPTAITTRSPSSSVAVGEAQPLDPAVGPGDRGSRRVLEQDVDAERLHRGREQRRGGRVELALHQAVHEVHDGRRAAEPRERVGGLRARAGRRRSPRRGARAWRAPRRSPRSPGAAEDVDARQVRRPGSAAPARPSRCTARPARSAARRRRPSVAPRRWGRAQRRASPTEHADAARPRTSSSGRSCSASTSGSGASRSRAGRGRTGGAAPRRRA